ncbi:MAG: 5-oxoprolinase subunit PxpB [Ignavibacteriales bacterium]|nr:5-oxoprolinase subunit PxpB [Ignavibacteriales bacterium]
MKIPVSFFPASDCSLLVKFGEGISLDTHKRVSLLTRLLLNEKRKVIRNLHPGYNSILISYDPLATSHSELEMVIRKMLEQDIQAEPNNRSVEVPTCYGDEYSPDLKDVSKHCKLSPEDVIRVHSSAEYTVFFLGFSPGFPYLGGMAAQLSVPRLAIPRTNVPAGSVAIGGNQTGVYPIASPGGWRIIGRTPLRLFDASGDPPTLLQIGDTVKFVPISKSEFDRLSQYR